MSDVIETFWNTYEAEGISVALANVRAHSETNDYRELELAVPDLVEAARGRNIDIIKFLGELDAEMARVAVEENQDAVRTDNGSGELHADSGDEADQFEDADDSASARDADGEAWEE